MLHQCPKCGGKMQYIGVTRDLFDERYNSYQYLCHECGATFTYEIGDENV